MHNQNAFHALPFYFWGRGKTKTRDEKSFNLEKNPRLKNRPSSPTEPKSIDWFFLYTETFCQLFKQCDKLLPLTMWSGDFVLFGISSALILSFLGPRLLLLLFLYSAKIIECIVDSSSILFHNFYHEVLHLPRASLKKLIICL